MYDVNVKKVCDLCNSKIEFDPDICEECRQKKENQFNCINVFYSVIEEKFIVTLDKQILYYRDVNMGQKVSGKFDTYEEVISFLNTQQKNVEQRKKE